jgi:hypothetical protein
VTNKAFQAFQKLLEDVNHKVAKAPGPHFNPNCFACNVTPSTDDIAESKVDIHTLLQHFNLPINSDINLALAIAWLYGWKAGGHAGMSAAVQQGLGVSEHERANAI